MRPPQNLFRTPFAAAGAVSIFAATVAVSIFATAVAVSRQKFNVIQSVKQSFNAFRHDNDGEPQAQGEEKALQPFFLSGVNQLPAPVAVG